MLIDLLDAIYKNARDFNEQNTANSLNALSKMDLTWDWCEEKDIANDLLDAIYKNARDFNPQDTANSLNALSKMGLTWESCEKKDIANRLHRRNQEECKRF